jgi:hypothetical protein
MTWTGIGGLIGAELMREVLSDAPDFSKIDRLLVQFLLDCVYRGYDLNYLITLFDRYLSQDKTCRDNLIHVFRRIHSRQRHEYDVFFILNGASSEGATSEDSRIDPVPISHLDAQSVDPDDLSQFKGQLQEDCSVLLRLRRTQDLDAGAAAEAAPKDIQEIVDFLDFDAPTQQFRLAPLSLVTYKDADQKPIGRLHPDAAGQQPPSADYTLEIESEWLERLKGLSEALRWSAVARREQTPEVSLLACWFAFAFLAAEIGDTPVEGIMEFFPKALAIGNSRRRLEYWYRSLPASPGFERHPRRANLDQRALHFRGALSHTGILELLSEFKNGAGSDDVTAIHEIIASSVLLRERTVAESRLFSNPQLLAQTMSTECTRTRWEFQRFMYIRNKLVHRARIDRPLLVVVSNRAKRLLYDLLRDLAAQLTTKRLYATVAKVLHDFRDTFEELLRDLGQTEVDPDFWTAQ